MNIRTVTTIAARLLGLTLPAARALHRAAKKGDAGAITALLEAGADWGAGQGWPDPAARGYVGRYARAQDGHDHPA